MAKKVRVKRFEKVLQSVDPRLWTALIALLTKIIGESVKDKVARAVLVGVLGAFGNYAASVAEVPEPPKQEVQQEVPQIDKPPL